MRNYRLKTKLVYLFRKSPVSFVLGTLLVVLCPVAVLQLSTSETSTLGADVVSDASIRRRQKPDDVAASNKISAEATGNVLAVPNLPVDEAGVLRDAVKNQHETAQQASVRCSRVMFNPNKPDFDLANLTYTLTDLRYDGDRGVWDEETDAKFYQAHPTSASAAGTQFTDVQMPQTRLKQGGNLLQAQSAPKLSQTAAGDPLLVFVVPFSHADPGWLNTVEQYFDTSIKFALDNMLERLQKWPDMTFIWAETSYFKMWWDGIDAPRRQQTKELLKSGRLEIVNGGYVMPDEASCHYYAILHQYVYGHQWLLENLGVVPEHGFSIDPFGHSSSLPYFLKNLDFKTMFIQRIHYNLRKHLVLNNASEFMWEQIWDAKNVHSMFTHLAPHHLYTIKNICSLQPGNCYFYDFHENSMDITDAQMESQANLLLENMRKTAYVYRHNVLLYILGDDFRWVDQNEWTMQYKNYKRIMKIFDSDPSKNVVMKFGTLKDYYDAVEKRTRRGRLPVPTVQGDFFPYADKFEDYWTGYFTSRPFYKQMSRELERDLRTAEILYCLAKVQLKKLGKKAEKDFYDDLVGLERAAKSLGLFQHHDAITGTSKRHVALDYGEKLQNGLLMAHAVILRNVFRIAQIATQNAVKSANIILDSYRMSSLSLPVKSILQFKDTDTERKVFIFNSLARSRTSVIHLYTETQNLNILDSDNRKIPYQVSPSLSDSEVEGEFLGMLRVSFLVKLEPLAIKVLTVRSLGQRTQRVKVAERSSTIISSTEIELKIPGFKVNKLESESILTVANSYFSATFSADDGMLQTIKTADGTTHKVEMEFKRYETQASGAYLFRPNGVGDLRPYPRYVRQLQGPIFCEVQVIYPSNIVHVYRIYNSTSPVARSIEMETISQLQNYVNSELVLKLSTKIRNNQTFFTDSNGFQMMKRRVNHGVPMSANYYPVTTTAFLQDEQGRLNLHFVQGHGVGSQKSGDLEVMLDRYLMQDDGRGVGEPLQDLRVIRTQMWLQVETTGFCTKDCPYNNPTSSAVQLNLAVNHPPYVTFEQTGSNMTAFEYRPLTESLPCDVHLVMMKPVTFSKKEKHMGIILHRLGMDCGGKVDDNDKCEPNATDVRLDRFVNGVSSSFYNVTGLNFVKVKQHLAIAEPVKIEHMSVVGVTLDFPQ